MGQIGTFTRNENGFFGRVRTLSLDTDLAIVPAEKSNAEKAPNHRVLLFGSEIGAAWDHTSEEAGPYLSVTIDDPCLPEPMRARLFKSREDENEWALHWSRRKQRDEQD